MRERMQSEIGKLLRKLQRPTSAELDKVRLAIGRESAMRVRGQAFASLRGAEFSVYSQWGEDGILQFLIDHVAIDVDTFVEVGVQDYRECNTRFLLCNDYWRGLIIDAGTAHVDTLERDGLRWRFAIDAVSAWVTKENVSQLIGDAGISGDIGLLSIDIDGNDYWVLEQALSGLSPRIIVVEYNSAFGPDHAVTVPYLATFQRTLAHPSMLYFGASLGAFTLLLGSHGYRLVGSNQAGNNAFFVGDDLGNGLPAPTVQEAYVQSRFRESRAADGTLTYLDPHREGLRLISHLPVVDLTSGREVTIGSLGIGD